jgi:hypothetical protein
VKKSVAKRCSNIELSMGRPPKIRKLWPRDFLNHEYRYKIVGRRIVELDYMAEQMICSNVECSRDLHLRYITGETLRGAASILKIQCMHCLEITNVKTNKVEQTTSLYSVNLKTTYGEQ